MIIDTSALIAVLLQEPDSERLLAALTGNQSLSMSAGSFLECAIVIDGRVGPMARTRFDQLIKALDVSIVAVTVEQASIAREAYRRFGRGSGHPARLNFGDCFAYALAVQSGEPLLFTGDDFTHTDIAAVHL